MLSPEEQARLKILANETGDDLPLIKEIIKDYKEGGFKKAFSENSAALVREAQEDFAAVTGALPVIKAGWKTTEFWLIMLVILGNGIYTAATGGKVLPFDLNATVAGLIGIYAVVRALVKKTPPLPPLPPAPPAP